MSMTIREQVGPYSLVAVSYTLAEGSVGAETDIPLSGVVGGSVVALEAPWSGRVVGMSIQSEASANFTVSVTVGGTAQTGTTTTVSAATGYAVFDDGTGPDFDAGDAIGVEVTASTTAKDINVVLYIAYNVG